MHAFNRNNLTQQTKVNIKFLSSLTLEKCSPKLAWPNLYNYWANKSFKGKSLVQFLNLFSTILISKGGKKKTFSAHRLPHFEILICNSVIYTNSNPKTPNSQIKLRVSGIMENYTCHQMPSCQSLPALLPAGVAALQPATLRCCSARHLVSGPGLVPSSLFTGTGS
jgi:hypothetical protein